jgi:hypothetical protein
VESIWTRAFNSFGFIALLVCVAVLLTTISFSNADDGRDPAVDLLLLRSQGALVVENRDLQSVSIPYLQYHD